MWKIGALAGMDPLVRCDAAKGFACWGQLREPDGVWQIIWRSAVAAIDGVCGW